MLDKKFNIPMIDPKTLFVSRMHSPTTIDLLAEEDKKKMLEEQANEEWIWIEGYKATDKDMKCRDYQYELNKQFDMPEDELIIECHSGFHLCKDLKDVFNYYDIGYGNRFFKVSALVRRKDYENCGGRADCSLYYNLQPVFTSSDKLVSKSIIFLNEVSVNDIIDAYISVRPSREYIKYWSDEDKKDALAGDLFKVRDRIRLKELVDLGYSEPLSKVIMGRGEYDTAVAAASQPDLSMDMRIAYILCNND